MPSDITYLIDYSSKIDTDPIAALKEGEIFECAAVIRLPHEAAEGEKLHVELQIDALRGPVSYTHLLPLTTPFSAAQATASLYQVF